MSRSYEQQRQDAIGSLPIDEDEIRVRSMGPKVYKMRLFDMGAGGESFDITDVSELEHERFRLIAERCNVVFGGYGEWQMIVQEVTDAKTKT